MIFRYGLSSKKGWIQNLQYLWLFMTTDWYYWYICIFYAGSAHEEFAYVHTCILLLLGCKLIGHESGCCKDRMWYFFITPFLLFFFLLFVFWWCCFGDMYQLVRNLNTGHKEGCVVRKKEFLLERRIWMRSRWQGVGDPVTAGLTEGNGGVWLAWAGGNEVQRCRQDILEAWKLLTGRQIMILGHKRNKLTCETRGSWITRNIK